MDCLMQSTHGPMPNCRFLGSKVWMDMAKPSELLVEYETLIFREGKTVKVAYGFDALCAPRQSRQAGGGGARVESGRVINHLNWKTLQRGKLNCIQRFAERPCYTEVNPGEDALLKCRIADKKGVCSWQKDNKCKRDRCITSLGRLSIACSTLSLARSAQAERDNESCFFFIEDDSSMSRMFPTEWL
ncbi:hypothetical protein EVAR_16157_1 [Eumeta japonica]|uniref:Uncharacterized protein n=1 Tax=Eumeta variegata TaxID=151549 RepID=A0A4C1WAS5_EUMVA|nr:hypothetical protein EVAR_16157_1 [Eumeta japonica]